MHEVDPQSSDNYSENDCKEVDMNYDPGNYEDEDEPEDEVRDVEHGDDGWKSIKNTK